MIPCCADMGVGLIPWSPLSRGLLTGRKKTKRTDTDKGLQYFAPTQADEVIIDRVIEIAEKKGLEPSQVAMAWLLSKPNVVAPIVGFSKIEYLDGIIGALQVKLSDEETKYLEEPYVPKKTAGFQ
jgi:aryl-alcohol dehydrogenase-like predicted oxidoreductase